jgi:hypothetical protein
LIYQLWTLPWQVICVALERESSRLMPSLRAVNQERERRERQSRIELARRRAAEVGVMTARSYVAAKQEQDMLVAQDLAARHQMERDRRIADVDRALYYTQAREGLGFAKAEEHATQQAARAAEELDAWEAEKTLERERYALALRREQLLRTQAELAKQEIAQRRLAVKEIELNRSRVSIGHQRCRSNNHDQQQHLNSTPNMSKTSYSIQVTSGPAAEPAHVVAARHKAERAEELQRERERVAKQRRCIAERAISVVAQQKEEEQRQQLEEEQDVLLRLTMIENAMRSTVRPISSSDFQEQESRKAQTASSKAAQDFERTFLAAASWSINDIRRTHAAPSEGSSTSTIFADAPVASLMISASAVRLQPRSFEPSPIKEEEEEEEQAVPSPSHASLAQCESNLQLGDADADDAHQGDAIVDLNISVEGPRCSDPPPQPIARTSPSLPPERDVQREAPTPAQTDPEEKPLLAMGPEEKTTTTTLAAVEASPHTLEDTATGVPPLRERHEQFLRDLQRLQQRLAQASLSDDKQGDATRIDDSDAAGPPGINDSTSTTITSEGSDVSLSSMSADADGTVRPRKTSSGMTAEQLRNALRKMKFGR